MSRSIGIQLLLKCNAIDSESLNCLMVYIAIMFCASGQISVGTIGNNSEFNSLVIESIHVIDISYFVFFCVYKFFTGIHSKTYS